MNILNYDYHSSLGPVANHHSPLYYLQNASEYQYDSRLNVVSWSPAVYSKGKDRNMEIPILKKL